MSNFIPKLIYWELCDVCNLSCKHCFVNSNPSKNSIVDKNLLFDKIKEINSINKTPLRFGGGEPFLVPYIFELFNYCKELEIPTSVTTNGTLLTYKSIKYLKELDLQSVTVSIDGLEVSNDELRGKGSFKRALNRLISLIDNGINVSVSFTTTSMNFKCLPQYVDFFYNLGIREFYIFRYIPNREDNEIYKLSANTLYEISEILMQIKAKYPKATFQYEKKGHLTFILQDNELPAKCKFINGIVTIKYDGSVVVCAAVNKTIGNIWEDKIEIIYENILKEIELISIIPDECKDCTFAYDCKGGCKNYSFSKYGNYSHMDNCCFLSMLK